MPCSPTSMYSSKICSEAEDVLVVLDGRVQLAGRHADREVVDHAAAACSSGRVVRLGHRERARAGTPRRGPCRSHQPVDHVAEAGHLRGHHGRRPLVGVRGRRGHRGRRRGRRSSVVGHRGVVDLDARPPRRRRRAAGRTRRPGGRRPAPRSARSGCRPARSSSERWPARPGLRAALPVDLEAEGACSSRTPPAVRRPRTTRRGRSREISITSCTVSPLVAAFAGCARVGPSSRLTFWPPNPNEFDSAYSGRASRGVPGRGPAGQAGSGSSRL